MSKNHPNPKGAGLNLVGSPKELINLLVEDSSKKEHIIKQISNGGPKHKQVLSALLLKRMYALMQLIEKRKGVKFSIQKGHEIILEKHDEEHALPIPFPISIGTKINKEKIVKAISRAPEHEALTFAMSLQVIEWAMKELGNKDIKD